MKKTLLLLTALSTGLLTNAQESRNPFQLKQTNRKHLQTISRLLQMQEQPAAQKPTGMQQRVIAQASSGPDASDSTHFKYSGTRGSRYNHNNMEFVYNETPVSSYDPMAYGLGGASGMDMLADSIVSFEDGDAYSYTKAWYRNDNKLDSFFNKYIGGSNTSYEKIKHTFYPGGYLHSIEHLYSEDGINFQSTQIRKITYNSTFTGIAYDSVFSDFGSGPELFVASRYHYNNDGKLDSVITRISDGTAMQPFSINVLSYYSSGKIMKIAGYTAMTGEDYSLSELDSVGYTNNSDYFTYWSYRYFDETGEPMEGSRIMKQPGSNGQPESVILSEWDTNTWADLVTISYTYNAYGNPEMLTGQMNGEPAGRIKFYYEEYDDGLSIKPLADNKDFSVYPNPFNDKITIDWKGKTQSDVTVRMVNMIGQEVYRSSLKLQTGANALTIPAINSGNYILLLQDAQGKSWSSKVVKK